MYSKTNFKLFSKTLLKIGFFQDTLQTNSALEWLYYGLEEC